MSLKDLKTGVDEVISKAEAKPSLSERQYGFGYVAINVNYLDDEMKKSLPPTDTRRRQD